MSPLLYYTKKQAEKISENIDNESVIIDFAMRDMEIRVLKVKSKSYTMKVVRI